VCVCVCVSVCVFFFKNCACIHGVNCLDYSLNKRSLSNIMVTLFCLLNFHAQSRPVFCADRTPFRDPLTRSLFYTHNYSSKSRKVETQLPLNIISCYIRFSISIVLCNKVSLFKIMLPFETNNVKDGKGTKDA
jgi:hypothetical protein